MGKDPGKNPESDTRVNCWEYMRCERQPGGKLAERYGVCPTPLERTGNGINGGENGGRCCWAIAGTLCFGEPHGTFAQKFQDCMDCAFFWMVSDEETDFARSINSLRQPTA
jgi:hypothetical protein